MADNISRGKVQKFFPQDERKYGFIIPDGKDYAVFFHFGRAEMIEFDGSDRPHVICNTGLNEPTIGERVVFVEEKAAKGPRAAYWIYEDIYNRVMRQIEENYPTT